MSQLFAPRVVLVRRPTEYELLIEQHGTPAQVKFALQAQGNALADVEERDGRLQRALDTVKRAIPRAWRSVFLLRSDLDRFVFEEKDILVAVGQDGLVANAAKYLSGQYVIGVNPDPSAYEGVLVPHDPAATADLLSDCAQNRARTQSRTMVEAVVDDGQRLLALNEIFLGHQSHQSARYRFAWDGEDERQSSSGIIVSTGTGSTGWARSVNLERNSSLALPVPEERKLIYFVREAFPGSGFATRTTSGYIADGSHLRVVSEMNVGGVLFGDGIEDDRVSFLWGAQVDIKIAAERLRLVIAG